MSEQLAQAALLAAAAFVAAAANGIVAGGTLLTFGLLTALGIPPVTANGTSSAGLSVGAFSAAWAYRRELAGRALSGAIAAIVIASALGATLVVALPARVFTTVVPWLILGSVALVALQPLVQRRLRGIRPDGTRVHRDLPAWTGLIGLYSGYFGAGQGVMLMAALGLRYDHRPQHANAAKNILGACANLTAGLVFLVAGAFEPWLAAAIAVGAVAGGYGGARVARRLPDAALRGVVIAVGLLAAVLVLLR